MYVHVYMNIISEIIRAYDFKWLVVLDSGAARSCWRQ